MPPVANKDAAAERLKKGATGGEVDTDEGFDSPSINRSTTTGSGPRCEEEEQEKQQHGRPSPPPAAASSSTSTETARLVVVDTEADSASGSSRSRSSSSGISDESDNLPDEVPALATPSVPVVNPVNSNNKPDEPSAATPSVLVQSENPVNSTNKPDEPPPPPADTTTTTTGTPPSVPTQSPVNSNTDNSVVEDGGASNNVQSVGVTRDPVECKAESLAEFIVCSLIGEKPGSTDDKVEQTLLRCVRLMMQKHEILLKGMMKRLDITRETGYVSFVATANELFEGEKQAVTWGRIVALYAFGGQLALYCKEKNMEDFCDTIASFMGKYASDVVAPFVRGVGGWIKICEEFPADDDMENKAWRVLTLTAIGLGLAATASFFTSH